MIWSLILNGVYQVAAFVLTFARPMLWMDILLNNENVVEYNVITVPVMTKDVEIGIIKEFRASLSYL